MSNPQPTKTSRNLVIRVLAAAIYFPLLMLTTFVSEVFTLVIFVLSFAAWHEYHRFRFYPENRSQWIHHFMIAFLGASPFVGLLMGLSISGVFSVLAAAFVALVAWKLIGKRDFEHVFDMIGFYGLGFIYITGGFGILCSLAYFSGGGREALWFIFLCVGVTDSAAYFVGRSFGRTPFFNKYSPKKTREGFLGGLLGALVLSIAFYYVMGLSGIRVPGLWELILLGAVVATSSALGDLFESGLKRFYGVKDAGSLIPGHGGVLDRFDGVIFGAVPVFVYVALVGSFGGLFG